MLNENANFTPTLKGYTGQQPFRYWCQTVLPLVYDDSLSYYELLNKVVNYLNNVISDVSNVEDNVQGLYNAYGQLQGYVNAYFDNLDVQSEINHKLDEMASDGTLSELISPFVSNLIDDVVAEQIDGAVALQIDSSVAGQIDDVVAEQIGTPAANATTAWLTANVNPVGSAVIVDSSLTISGAAADSKTVGDKISTANSKINGCGEFRQSFYGLNYPANLVCVNTTTFYGLGNAFTINFDFLGKVRAFTAVNTDLICEVMDEELNMIATATAQNKGQGLYFYDFNFNCDVSRYNVIVIGIRSTEKSIYRLGSTINMQFIPTSSAQGIYYGSNGWQALSSVSQTVPIELYGSEFVLDSVKEKETFGYNANNYISSLRVVSGDFGYASYSGTAEKLSIVSEISLYCDTDSVIHFIIGRTDQNELLIPSLEFELSTQQGYHTYDVKSRKLIVKPGERLFVQADDLQVRTNNTSGYEELIQKPIDIQDGTESQTPGYEGLVLVSHDDLLIVFSYEIEEYDDTHDRISSLENKVENLSANEQKYTILAKPNGDKFRLMLNSSGEFILNKYYPKKLFVMGNSLTDTTYHAQNDHYYQIGLAASNNHKDFYALLCDFFKEKDTSFTGSRRNFASWETATTSAARLNIIENNLANLVNGNEDMIIIQLGDNVSTPSQLSTFPEDYKYLIQWFRENCPTALVVCAGMWYFTEEKLGIVKTAADDMGVIFADFSRFALSPEYCSAIGNVQTIYDENDNVVGTRTISDSGSASHPGDEGMKKIAQTIIDAIYS